jgi:hypothetical protein
MGYCWFVQILLPVSNGPGDEQSELTGKYTKLIAVGWRDIETGLESDKYVSRESLEESGLGARKLELNA